MIHATLGYVQFCARKFDQGCELLEKAVQLDPNLFQIRVGLGYAYGYRGEHDRGIAEIQKGLGLSLGGSEFITWLGEAHVRAGHRDQAEKVLEDAVELSKQRYVSSYYIARLCAALGRSEDTLQWLNTAYQERAAWLAFVNIDPVLDIVRSDPRFQDLLRRMNFPEG
jgi:tetratricopeptide (TPR) repeat protein